MEHHCFACSAPLSSPKFKGVSDTYCKYCADENGVLKSREAVRAGIAYWFMSWQPGVTQETAASRAEKFMSGLPAWAED